MPHPALNARIRRCGIPVVVALLTAGLLAGCTAQPEPAPTAASGTAGSTPSPAAPTPAAPQLVPEGSAADNLPLFTAVAESVWASPQKAEGRAYIDALVGAGFDKAAMQITDDASTIGNPAESLEFSVRWGQECLVGQVGPVADTVITITTDALPSGGCLLGATRPIDW
ncbi:DUF6993 domain-containing protein [Microbacterium sp. NPDC058021]|uniref:DUF6993 domain-containing protein n=1 Tax=Microbacterium sp. NPDC058021 TaxID=3346306 RepID=UPI0036DE78E7